MKLKRHLISACLLLALPLHAQTPSAPPAQRVLGTAPTEWPGVHFEITRIQRLSDDYILVAVRMRGDASTKNPTAIFGEKRPTEEDPDNVTSFTLTKATLLDPLTGKQYPADGKLPSSPYWGDPDILSTIGPNTWFQLAVRFKAPPPLLGQDGKPIEQKVIFMLPRAKEPIKNVILPHAPATSEGAKP